MKTKNKIAFLLGTAFTSIPMAGCSKNNNYISLKEYSEKVKVLSNQIKNDMINVGLNVDKYEITPNPTLAEDFYIMSVDQNKFLVFPDDYISFKDLDYGDQKSIVAYQITNFDVEYVNSLEKSKWYFNGKVDYKNILDEITNVIKKDTSKLYSVKIKVTNEEYWDLYTLNNKGQNKIVSNNINYEL